MKYINRSFYKKVAKKHGVSVEEVKRGIQEAIDAAYLNPNFKTLCINNTGEKPTIDEFIDYCAKKIMSDLDIH